MCSPISVWQNEISAGFSRGIFLGLTGSKTICLSTTCSFVKSSRTPIVNSVYLSTPLNTIDTLITVLLFLWSYGVHFVAVVAALFADFTVAENQPSLRIEGEDSGSGDWLLSFSLFFLSFFLFSLSLDLFYRGRRSSSILSLSSSLAPAPEFSSLRLLLMLLWVTLSFILPFSWFFSFPSLTSSSDASAVGAFAVLFASSFDSVAAACLLLLLLLSF